MKVYRHYVSKGTYLPGSVISGRDFRIDVVSTPASHYGLTWRGITRPNDREHGIIGGELIVLNLKTDEILGFRRVFVRSYFDAKYQDSRTMWGEHCNSARQEESYEFIQNILRPAARS